MRALVLVAMLGAVGCKKEGPAPATTWAPDASPTAKAAVAPVHAAIPPDAAPIARAVPDAAPGGLPAIEKTRWGALVAGKKVSKRSLASLFPTFKVEEFEDYIEDEVVPGFAVKRGDDVVARVRTSGGKLLSVIVDAPDVPVAVGLGVGAPAERLAASAGKLSCWTEFEWDGSLMCKGDNAENVTFVLARDGGYAQNTDEDAPAAIKLLVAGAKVEHVVWVPPNTP